MSAFQATATLVGALLSAIVIVNIWAYRRDRNDGWHSHFGRMRRMTARGWQYRPMSDSEAAADQSDHAI